VTIDDSTLRRDIGLRKSADCRDASGAWPPGVRAQGQGYDDVTVWSALGAGT